VLGNWLFSHGYVEVTVPNAKSGSDTTYTLINQTNNKETVFKNQSGGFKQRVARGPYEVRVRQGASSYLAAFNSKRFLGTTTITATLATERARQFVGNNPAPCMYHTGSVLYSYECTSSFTMVNTHVPATATQPTYIAPAIGSRISGTVEGIVATNKQVVALSKEVNATRSNATHTFYTISPDYKTIAKAGQFSTWDVIKNYTLKPLGPGLVAHDSRFGDIKYFATPDSNPVTITVPKPSATDAEPDWSATNGNTLLLSFSNNLIGQVNNIEDSKPSGRVKNTMIVHRSGKTKIFTVPGQITYGRLCSETLLCLVQHDQLVVYDIAGKQPKRLRAFSGVDALEVSGSTLYTLAGKEVYRLNPEDGTGSVVYSMGEYSSCGLRPNAEGVLLCTMDPRNNKRALLINPAAENTDSIDKKVVALQTAREVHTVSAYGKFIYISPNLGERQYIPSLGYFGYDPTMQANTNKAINDKLNEINIDRSVYTIVNTAP
jgi:hypothetical protein